MEKNFGFKYVKNYEVEKWPDHRFCLLLERIVHPENQQPEKQQELVEIINDLLKQDYFELKQEGLLGGFPVYKTRRLGGGVTGTPKYIIFACNGPKPEIVIDDAVNMDIRIIKNADKCLVYDQPPPSGDLTWQMLVEWWGKKEGKNIDDAKIRRSLGERIRSSLQEGPEQLFFDTYFKSFHKKLKANLPALLPQVYLHYDPRNQNERVKPILFRQRLDFIMLLRNSTRIIIEIDGVQHYSDNTGKANTQLYGEMVAEDRRIKGLGYEVFRFGGAEFVEPQHAINIIEEFLTTFFIDME